MTVNDYSVVDLFCGVGGLTHGFQKEGFHVSAGIDFDINCKFAYEVNNDVEFIHRDVGNLQGDELSNMFPCNKRKVLIGCAPCQPFSIFNRKNGGEISKTNSERFKLLYAFARLIKDTQPEIISMENVPLLKGFKKGKVFNDFVRALKKEGYSIFYDVIDAQNYGVPQRRKRLVLLGSKLGEIEMIPPTHPESQVYVRNAIGMLPEISAGEVHAKDPLHRSRNLSELSLERIKATPEGGGWKDWKDELIADCHKRGGGKAFGSAYGRMSWDAVAPTMTTCCIGYNNGKFGHPEQDRAISLREAALLQSFPIGYNFIDPERNFSSGQIAKQIGNAVPVLLGQAIAKSVVSHIQKFDDGE